MRPIKLEIEGLQSFSQKQTIDFESLTEHGLFGIFGKTGSGKSTILDAITLAIYGDIVRIGNSKDDKLINLLNVNSEKLEVTYTFKLGETTYSINRKYPKKKKELAFSSKKVVMCCEGEVIADKDKEIKAKVDELIGLSMDDFTRSVVLPQGKFSEFLKLTGKEKRDMLERIFSLEEYGRKLMFKLNLRKKAKKEEVEAIKNQIIGKGSIEPEALEELKKSLKETEEQYKEILEEKEEFIKTYDEKKEIKELLEESEKYNTIKTKLEEQKEEIHHLEISIENNEDSKKIVEKYNDKNNLDKIIVKENKDLEKNQTLIKNIEETINNLDKEIEINKNKEIEYKSLSESLEVDPQERKQIADEISIVKDLNRLSTEIKKTNKTIETNKESIEKTSLSLTQNQENLENNKNLEKEIKIMPQEELTELLLVKNKLESEIKEVERLETTIVKLEKKLIEDSTQYNKLGEELEKLDILIQVEEAKIRNDIAYGLAKDLKEGESCPVCGGKDHPQLANPSVEIDEDLLSQLKQEKEMTSSKYHKINIAEINDELNSNNEELNNRISEDLNKKLATLNKEYNEKLEEKESLETKKAKLEKEIQSLEKEEVKLKNTLENLEKSNLELIDQNKIKIEEKSNFIQKLKETSPHLLEKDPNNTNFKEILEELITKSNELEKQEKESIQARKESEKYRILQEKSNKEKETKINEKSEISTKITALETSINLKSQEIKKLEEELETLVGESKFDTLEDSVSSALSDEKVEEYTNKISKYKEGVIKNNGLIENTSTKLNNRELKENEWDEITLRKAILEENENMYIKNITSKTKEIRDIEKIQEETKELEKEMKSKTIELNHLEELSKLFLGNAFVEYLAMGKLRNITVHASKRLEKITNGRYGIEVGEDASFIIRDNFNGGVKRRSATLSGGETFLVSLSLALALSNQIQLKGKANLEFFFLDEGFGTLDSSLLDRVISSLESLRKDEKLKVGIITHVEELKDRVPRKLVISEAIPGERGSKVNMN